MYYPIKSHVSDYNNFYDNPYGTISVHENDKHKDTGLLDQYGVKLFRVEPTVKMGFHF